MSPSASISQRAMASGGAKPKRNTPLYNSRGMSRNQRDEDVMDLRQTLYHMDKKLSRALGLPPALENPRYQEDQELLHMRNTVIQMDKRLSTLLGNDKRRAPNEANGNGSSPPDPELCLLGQSVQQCLQGLSKLSRDVNRLTLYVNRQYNGGSVEEESTIFDDEELLPPPSTLNNQTSHLASRPNNYWDNFRSFSRRNPLAEQAPQRRGKSKINREYNVDSITRTNGAPPVNLTDTSSKCFSKEISMHPSEEEDEYKSVFDVIHLVQVPEGNNSAVGDRPITIELSHSEASGGSNNHNSRNNTNQDVDCLIETAKMNDLSLEDDYSIEMENTCFLSDDDDNYQSQEKRFFTTMYDAEYVRNKLQKELAPKHLDIVDESDGCGAKYNVVIVSDKFEGKPLLQRHRLVNSILEEELKIIHAFSQKNLHSRAMGKTFI
ncbi:unnamed protein product [Lepeophtheirus salmonis]|uniref:(salmon louse) hypothetical protein n=1 Tax=Lepeophtheirus salmonis TaxID=72036 RepID=A0A7R8H7S6_LEPSM|nr:unnamed protein product [Lepeophtheirus salmonis]CAF2916487.1 unnamed protein product [Lepeophtheirus salmonis]